MSTSNQRALRRQNEYISNANEKVKYVLDRYTSISGFTPKKDDWMLELMAQTFSGVPVTEEPIRVYRGLSTVNFIPEIKGYISTSYDRKVARNLISDELGMFGYTGSLIEILVPAGSKILPLETISRFPREREVLLPNKGKFIVTSEHWEDQIRVYDVIYVPENAMEINSNTTVAAVEEKLGINELATQLSDLASERVLNHGANPQQEVKAIVEASPRGISKAAITIAVDHLKTLQPQKPLKRSKPKVVHPWGPAWERR